MFMVPQNETWLHKQFANSDNNNISVSEKSLDKYPIILELISLLKNGSVYSS